MKHNHPNHVILHDGEFFRIFERMGKKVPYEAYNPMNHKGIGITVDECLQNTDVSLWDIDSHPVEVIFNE